LIVIWYEARPRSDPPPSSDGGPPHIAESSTKSVANNIRIKIDVIIGSELAIIYVPLFCFLLLLTLRATSSATGGTGIDKAFAAADF
jgi:hypothetical protein